MSELSNLKSSVSLFENTLKKAREAREFLNLDISEEEANLVSEDINSIKDTIKKLRLEILLNGEFDKCNAYIEIHISPVITLSSPCTTMYFNVCITLIKLSI